MKPSWQEITKEAELFAETRNISVIDAIICFKHCANFIAKHDKLKFEIKGTDLAGELKKKIDSFI
jgi:hypothetical protein